MLLRRTLNMAGILVSPVLSPCIAFPRGWGFFFAHPQRNPPGRPANPFAFNRLPTATKWQ
jgi:hypothetical protein